MKEIGLLIFMNFMVVFFIVPRFRESAGTLTLAVLWPNILGHEIMLLWTAAQYIGFVMAAIATALQALETLL